ncbi:MAG: CDP-alcohol phosphatidyltransferase family protein [Bryobacterales bacterium]|nr:CDP-alcohol phosphatidyltransferase family protein [Bryobacteraceae bacterium]MDW8354046.1 CDP-alcohol phosphatidyltransferase family protein [Bryobacterales bacterium]
MNLPNLLSATRLALAPPLVASIASGEYRRALVLLALAGVTDSADGLLARRYGWQTRLGAYLDPVADKVLLVGVYLALGASGLLPWWLVALVFGRDVAILAAAGTVLLRTEYRDFRPSVWGKLSTIFQILAALSVLSARASEFSALGAAADLLIPATGVFTAWSGLHYAWWLRKELLQSSVARR